MACTLDVLGDRWSLLVVRDLLRGKKRYAEFLESPEGIPTNILAERLKRLTARRVIRSRRYSQHPPRVDAARRRVKIFVRSCGRWWSGASGMQAAMRHLDTSIRQVRP